MFNILLLFPFLVLCIVFFGFLSCVFILFVSLVCPSLITPSVFSNGLLKQQNIATDEWEVEYWKRSHRVWQRVSLSISM